MREDDDRCVVVGADLRERFSGQATSSSSAFGTRSFVAKRARASATTVRQPTSLAAAQ